MKVSVIIPFFNEEKYIKGAIDSIKEQTYKNFECILVDNGSNDNSRNVAEEAIAGDERFKMVEERQQGIDKALNKGIKIAKGEYISFLDADDIYFKERLEKTIKVAQKNSVDLVVCKSVKYDERNGKSKEFTPYVFSEKEVPYLLFIENVLRSMSYILIKKEALKKITPFPEKYNLLLDYYIAVMSILKNLKIVFINKNLVLKRYHKDNMAHDRFKSDYQDIHLIEYFLGNHPKLKKFFTKKEIKIIFTRKYIRGANYGRRNGFIDKLPEYLFDFVKKGLIKKEFYFYFTAISYLKTDYKKFENLIAKTKIRHPFIYYFKGIKNFNEKRYKKASEYFYKAYIKSLEKFPEALNSLAIAFWQYDKKKALETFKIIEEKFPYYNDAISNYSSIKRGREENLKHTIFFMKETFEYFLYF